MKKVFRVRANSQAQALVIAVTLAKEEGIVVDALRVVREVSPYVFSVAVFFAGQQRPVLTPFAHTASKDCPCGDVVVAESFRDT